MTRPSAEMPVPPPFMWACGRCGTFLEDMAVVLALPERDACSDVTDTELAFAGHIADDHHPQDVPPPHDDGCRVCPVYRDHLPEIWAEHRARDLFLPEDIARLM